MSSSMMVLGITLKAFDQMTGGLKNAGKSVDGLRAKLGLLREEGERFGRGALADGLIAGGAMLKSVKAFSDLEDASTRLKATMMDKNGITGAYSKVNDLAVELGNRLPGTTAEFVNMMQALKSQGIEDESILNGVGESAAYLAVLLKKPSDEAAIFSAKMKQATGTVDQDMIGLMDTIQRLNNMGVLDSEMMYAFSRSGGALKTFEIQGLKATKALAPIFGLLIKGGMSGETIGTGFASILGNMADKKKLGNTNKMLAGTGIKLDFFDKGGNFKGVENMVTQLDKLKKLDPVKMNAALKELTGGGQDQQMLAQVITSGLDGYKKMVADMEAQASLQRRVNMQLGTLANLWEAASGTFTNALAAFAETFAPEIKQLTMFFGQLSEKIQGFIKTHPVIAKWLGLAIGGFVVLTLGAGALALAFASVIKYIAFISILAPVATALIGVMRMVFLGLGGALRFVGQVLLVVGRALLLNPIGLAITAIAGGAYLIYKYWEPIKGFFKNLWNGIVDGFRAAVQAISTLMPEWLKNNPSAGTGRFTSVRPTVNTIPGQNNKLNGELKVTLHDNRAPTVAFNSNQNGLKVINNGAYMVSH